MRNNGEKAMKFSTFPIMIASAIFALGAAGPAQAFVNGGFEDATLAPWTTAGGANQQTTVKTITAPEGSKMVSMRTVQNGGFASAASAGSLAAFLGLSTGDLNTALGGTVFNGSAIRQHISLAADSLLSLQFALGTLGGGGNDTAFIIINGVLTVLTDLNAGGFTVTGIPDGVFQPFQTFISSVLTAGDYDISVGVADIGNGNGRSILLVDDFLLDSENVQTESFQNR